MLKQMDRQTNKSNSLDTKWWTDRQYSSVHAFPDTAPSPSHVHLLHEQNSPTDYTFFSTFLSGRRGAASKLHETVPHCVTKLGMVVHTCNPGSWKVEAGGPPQCQRNQGVHDKTLTQNQNVRCSFQRPHFGGNTNLSPKLFF